MNLRTWRVWITGYPDSGVTLNVRNLNTALREGAKTQKACHHGEVIEINAKLEGEDKVYRYLARISRDGTLRYEGKS